MEQGTNVLVGTAPDRILEAARAALAAPVGGAHRVPELWDGKAAGRIVEAVTRLLA